ncbi:unnamed protein product [Protopolystoma xenopodis]|uniref:Uncharacterized protein n=1 Tax=Protopolystoma xenopodis TaxID=117903 RepID=A0A448XQQ1_9PLAT|nr:unnamed protein product [Protopolystoma xenopodis]
MRGSRQNTEEVRSLSVAISELPSGTRTDTHGFKTTFPKVYSAQFRVYLMQLASAAHYESINETLGRRRFREIVIILAALWFTNAFFQLLDAGQIMMIGVKVKSDLNA